MSTSIYATASFLSLSLLTAAGIKFAPVCPFFPLLSCPPSLPPSCQVADNEGLEFISFINRGKPQFGFLAGANSIYMNLPRTILRAAFNVDAQLIDKLRQTRLFDYVILPPPATQEDGGVEQSEQITNSWQAAMMGENNLASLFSEEENLDFDE